MSSPFSLPLRLLYHSLWFAELRSHSQKPFLFLQLFTPSFPLPIHHLFLFYSPVNLLSLSSALPFLFISYFLNLCLYRSISYVTSFSFPLDLLFLHLPSWSQPLIILFPSSTSHLLLFPYFSDSSLPYLLVHHYSFRIHFSLLFSLPYSSNRYFSPSFTTLLLSSLSLCLLSRFVASNYNKT